MARNPRKLAANGPKARNGRILSYAAQNPLAKKLSPPAIPRFFGCCPSRPVPPRTATFQGSAQSQPWPKRSNGGLWGLRNDLTQSCPQTTWESSTSDLSLSEPTAPHLGPQKVPTPPPSKSTMDPPPTNARPPHAVLRVAVRCTALCTRAQQTLAGNAGPYRLRLAPREVVVLPGLAGRRVRRPHGAVPSARAQAPGGAVRGRGGVGLRPAVVARVAGACGVGQPHAIAVVSGRAVAALVGGAQLGGVPVRPQRAGRGGGDAGWAVEPCDPETWGRPHLSGAQTEGSARDVLEMGGAFAFSSPGR